jgi:hypothetical protein
VGLATAWCSGLHGLGVLHDVSEMYKITRPAIEHVTALQSVNEVTVSLAMLLCRQGGYGGVLMACRAQTMRQS